MLLPQKDDSINIGDLIGMLLGDASLGKPKDCKNPRINITHSIRQKDYALYKAELLKTRFKVHIWYGRRYIPKTKKYYGQISMITSHDRRLLGIWKRFYNSGSKRVPKIISAITPRGLALWYFDDGSLITHTRVRKGKRIYDGWNCTFATDSFPLEDQTSLVEMLKTNFDIRARVIGKRKRYYLYINNTESKKMLEIIRPFATKDMIYKVNYQSRIEKTKRLLQKKDDEIV